MSRSDRNISIELLRILSFCMVIANHILNRHYTGADGTLFDGVCLWNMFNIVAVPCFFMITGYYSFRDDRWGVKIKKCILNIVIPTMVSIVLTLQVLPFFLGEKEFLEVFSFDGTLYQELWSHLRSWNVSMRGISHLWYIQSYVRIMILWPVLMLICRSDKKASFARRFILILLLAGYGIQNWMNIYPNEWMVLPYLPFDTSILSVLIGYEVSQIKDKIPDSRKVICGLAGGYVLFSVIGYLLERLLVNQTGSFNDYFFHYTSVPCQIASVFLFLIFVKWKLSLPDGRFVKILRIVAKSTFVAYLIQGLFLLPVSGFFESCIRSPLLSYLVSIAICCLILLSISTLYEMISRQIVFRLRKD